MFNNTHDRLRKIELKLEDIARSFEKSGFYEYIQYTNDKSRLMWRNFFAGIARGLGFAVGFSILGAIVIIILQQLANSSVPYIADFISKVIDVMEKGATGGAG